MNFRLSIDIWPIHRLLSGVIAQEIVKFVGKYMPLHQYLYFDMFEYVAGDGLYERGDASGVAFCRKIRLQVEKFH